jgi:hypothetical protein
MECTHFLFKSTNVCITHGVVLGFHNFGWETFVAYNTDDYSLSMFTSIKKHIVLKEKMVSEVVDSQSVAFDRITNIEIEGNLMLLPKWRLRQKLSGISVEVFLWTSSNCGMKSYPTISPTMETDTVLMHKLSNGPFEETRIASNVILLVVDKVYYCKQVAVSDSLNRKVNVGGQVSVINSKVLKGKVKVVIENSCNSYWKPLPESHLK